MTVALLMATAGLMRPATHFPPLGSSLVPSRAAIRLTDEQVDAGATDAVWPKPAKSVAELQQAQLADGGSGCKGTGGCSTVPN